MSADDVVAIVTTLTFMVALPLTILWVLDHLKHQSRLDRAKDGEEARKALKSRKRSRRTSIGTVVAFALAMAFAGIIVYLNGYHPQLAEKALGIIKTTVVWGLVLLAVVVGLLVSWGIARYVGMFLAVRRINAALRLERLGETARAIEQLKREVRARPKWDAVHVTLAAVLARAEQYVDALLAIDTAIGLREEFPLHVADKAAMLGMAGRLREATELIEKLVSDFPDDFRCASAYCCFLARHGTQRDANLQLSRVRERFDELSGNELKPSELKSYREMLTLCEAAVEKKTKDSATVL